MTNTTRLVLCGALALAGMKFFDLSPMDAWAHLQAKSDQAVADSRDLMSGEYSAKVADKLRQEARAMPTAQATQPQDQLSRELTAERQRIMQAKAAALEQRGSMVLQGDLDGLKQAVAGQAKNAGGSQ